MMNFLKACGAFVSVCVFSPAFADVSEYEHVIHPGNDDGTGFWNVNADWFMYAPAFGFKRVDGAAAYLFKVTDRYGCEHRFDASAAALTDLADACCDPKTRTPGHGCISECEKEKMTHTISPVLHKGVLYGFYQAGETHTVEAVWDPTELMRLSILPWDRRTERPRIVDAGVAGQDFGCFVQTAEMPPCAQTMTVKDDVLHLFFRGRRVKGAPGLWCLRTYDTRTGKMSEGAEICTLDGKEFNGETARDAYNRLTGDCQVKCAVGDECNVRRFSDGRFYTVMSVGADCVGLVLSSENLRDWTSVMGTPDLRQGATMEYEIFELSKGTWMSAWRQEKLGGVWTATYDVATKTWSSPAKVADSIAVKPYLFSHRGTNYLAANLRGSVTTPGYGTAVRATLGIFRVSLDGTLSLARKIVNPTGCHYVSTVEDGEGGLYLFYSTDERKLDATQCRSNIAFDLLEL